MCCGLRGRQPGNARGAAHAGSAPAESGDEIENHTNIAIKELNIKPEAAPSWGDNKLSGGPLAPGKTISIRQVTETNCKYKMRAVFQDGLTEERSVDICRDDRVAFGVNRR